MNEESYEEKQENRRNWLSLDKKLLFIAGVPLGALILTLFVFHFYRIDGPSMEKTLQNNDRVIIEKFGRTWARITGDQYIPKRYDVVVFKNPNAQGERELIKRVIALPGERVTVVNNDVRVFNNDNPDGILVDSMAPAEATIDDVTAGYIDAVLAQDEIFVLGDNRDASYDSRDFGPIKTDVITGTLTLRFYPLQDVSFY